MTSHLHLFPITDIHHQEEDTGHSSRGQEMQNLYKSIIARFSAQAVSRLGWNDALAVAGYKGLKHMDLLAGMAAKTFSNNTNHVADATLHLSLLRRAWLAPNEAK